jgi:hypothetical protein
MIDINLYSYMSIGPYMTFMLLELALVRCSQTGNWFESYLGKS